MGGCACVCMNDACVCFLCVCMYTCVHICVREKACVWFVCICLCCVCMLRR